MCSLTNLKLNIAIMRDPTPGAYEPVMDERSYRRRLPDFREADTLQRSRLNVSFYLVNHKLGYKLLLSDILPQFEDIKNRICFTVLHDFYIHRSINGECELGFRHCQKSSG